MTGTNTDPRPRKEGPLYESMKVEAARSSGFGSHIHAHCFDPRFGAVPMTTPRGRGDAPIEAPATRTAAEIEELIVPHNDARCTNPELCVALTELVVAARDEGRRRTLQQLHAEGCTAKDDPDMFPCSCGLEDFRAGEVMADWQRCREALTQISSIRDSIIGHQGIGWSQHIYPLVAILDAAGFTGIGYEDAKRNLAAIDARILRDEAAANERKSARAALSDPVPTEETSDE